ncbi:inositol monophosphatase [Geothrix oryzae]|uniref:Inositol-1-monophosphatase n=1 Tax=Geothrix oryzae TaxID=2927975 RepID=A0ABM8DPJ9_9BACT|nr:inositol monophosphatase family protein [Geothrix oryzae]BDU68825.1 inositol monophosphatase [Geothrix oryzae]
MHEAQRDACVAAARAGGKILLGYFRRLDPATITEKTKNDVVSAADRDAEAAIRAELHARFPGYGFLGEEGGFTPPEARGGEGPGGPPVAHRWIVDPLDGTLNFVQGFPHWCVSVALWDADGPVVGCVLDPLREDCFLAARGQGATWNGKPMRVSQQAGLDGAFLATGFAFQLGDRWPRFNAALDRVFPRAKGIRRAGSAALDLAHVACGIFDGYFELGLKPWDLAAGALLVQEAGGVLTDWDGGQGWFESGNLVVGTQGVQLELIESLRA